MRREDGSRVPGVAQGAIQSGKHAARMIRADLAGRPRTPFHYVDKGDLATIGRAAAVARLGVLQFSGFLAWLLWALVHIFYLIGFRNRIVVMIDWAWSYITYQRGTRLITGDPKVEIWRARAPDDP
jgi:NADH dehydrogenase